MAVLKRTTLILVGVVLGCSVVLLLLAAGCSISRDLSGSSRRDLTAREVEVLFAGKTVKGYHEKDHYWFTSFYEPDGTFRSHQGGDRDEDRLRASKPPGLGRWWVNSNSDICIRWNDEGSDLCRTMETDDRGHYFKVLVKPRGRRILIVTFESFTDGNIYDL